MIDNLQRQRVKRRFLGEQANNGGGGGVSGEECRAVRVRISPATYPGTSRAKHQRKNYPALVVTMEIEPSYAKAP